MSLGHIPWVERLRTPARPPQPWTSASWAAMGERELPVGRRRGGRGIILDLDDTLYPRERFVSSGFAAVAEFLDTAHQVDAQRAFGLLTRAHAGPQHGQEFQWLCDRTGLSRELVPVMLDVFRRHLPAIQLNSGVADALRALRSEGWRLGILTNGLPSVQFRKVAALGLASLVDDIVYAEEHAVGGKPSAAAFRAILRALDLAPEQCLCVGDDVVRDIRDARALGMRTVRLVRPGARLAACDEADMVIHSLRELPGAAGLVHSMTGEHVA